MRRFRFLGLVVLIWFPAVVLSQDNGPGNWIMYFGQNRFTDKLSLHTEAQYRNFTPVPGDLEQLLLRTGINYHIKPGLFVTGGYGYIANHEFESEQLAPETVEHRIWQQLINTTGSGRFKAEHRYRAEQRWVNGDYRNRFRYRINPLLALNKPGFEKGTVFLSVYDEIFLNTKEVFFDRNRFYAAAGYTFSDKGNVQVGMLHQQTSQSGKWHLQMAFTFNPDFRKN